MLSEEQKQISPQREHPQTQNIAVFEVENVVLLLLEAIPIFPVVLVGVRWTRRDVDDLAVYDDAVALVVPERVAKHTPTVIPTISTSIATLSSLIPSQLRILKQLYRPETQFL